MLTHRHLFLAVCLLSVANLPAQSPKADLILIHGNILTVDAHDTVTQAIAIRAGRILKTGTDAEIQSLAGPDTKIIDLKGHTATPGLIDTHAHIAEGGVGEVFGVNLSDATSVAEIVARVRAKATTLKPGEWITGAGWDEGKLAEHRLVTAADLDAAAPNNPVWLMHTTGHYGVANSTVLKLANITAATLDPPAGTIDRDAKGNPTGVLKEQSAMDPVLHLIPAITPEQEAAGILYIQKILFSEGMTAVKDPDIFPLQWTAYKSLLDSGQLKARICVLWDAGITIASAQIAIDRINAVPRLPATLGDGHLASCGAKIFMDGSGGARTGWAWDPWLLNSAAPSLTATGQPNTGFPHLDPAEYQKIVRLFHHAGVPVGTHAVGDRAMDWVVDTYALIEKEEPRPGLRHSIIHANLPTPHALDVMSDLQKKYDAGYPEMQPEFLWWIGDIYGASYGAVGYNATTIGPARAQRIIPLKTLQTRGILWSGGSDYFVTPIAARYGLWASLARETAKGAWGPHPFGTAESIDAKTALRSYTAWAAPQMFMEKEIGTLEPGKKADIAIWEQNIYTIPTAQIKDLKCLMTLIDGQIVFTTQ